MSSSDNYEITDQTSNDENQNEKGFLVYIFAGDQNQAEISIFRKICMKYSLQAWDEMMMYLPWRNKAALRTTLCKIIRKQALSEYDNIRADPFVIQKDNMALGNDENSEEEYTMKGGMLINQKWDRTTQEWEEMRVENAKKYMISEEEAASIEIPSIISIEHMTQLCSNRRQSLLLYRAAIVNEIAKRKNEEPVFDVKDLCLMPAEFLCIPNNQNKLEYSKTNEFFFSVDDKSIN